MEYKHSKTDGIRINPEYVRAAFDGDILLYHLNLGQTLSLNQADGIILDLMDGQHSATDIRRLLQEAHPESADEIECDIDRTLQYLLQHGALDSPSQTDDSAPAVSSMLSPRRGSSGSA